MPQHTNIQQIIDLGKGHPDEDKIPLVQLAQSANLCFEQAEVSFLQYTNEWGNPVFRQQMADFLTQTYGLQVQFEDVFISGGVSQALDLCCTMLARPGDTIFVEDPTFFLAFDIFKNRGLNIISIPTDQDGLQIEALTELLKVHQPKLLYTIPTHQNPSGVTLNAQRRKQLVELAQQHDFLILSDEVYHLLTYQEQPPDSFSAYVDTGQVLSLGSFSKILAPGLRLGWIHARQDVLIRLAQNGMLLSGGGLNPFASGVVSSLLAQDKLSSVIAALCTTYCQRLVVMVEALNKLRHLGVGFYCPRGGYFIWVELPSVLDSGQVLKQAQKRGLSFHPGQRFTLNQTQKNRLRLCFAYYSEPKLCEGIWRLEQAIENSILV